MASYPPPNQSVAIFNPLNFISGGEGLTLDEGKKFFLQFPDAQGTENMETTNIDGVFTANDQAFFNDTITLEQTDTGEDALNILVDSPGYAIRATTRTDPTTNTQITILPTATSGEVNSIVQLGDALIYSTTGNLAGGSLAITALGAVDEFGIRLNDTDEAVEIGGQLELLNKGIKFSDGTIQSTAYTGDGSEDLAEVLLVGNSAGSTSINMNNNNIENVNILQLGSVFLNETDNTLALTMMGQKTFVNNLVSFEPVSGKLLYSPSAPGIGSICLGLSAGGSTAGDFSICIGQGSGNTSGNNCIAIGQMANCNPFGNSIVLTATGFGISPANTGLYIDSIRNVSNSNALLYNTSSNEITYAPAVETLGDVLDNGNIASQDIYMNGNNLTDVNFLQFGTGPGLLVGETDNTLTISPMGTTSSVNNVITYDPATGKLLYQPTPFEAGSVSLGANASSGTLSSNRVNIGNASGANSRTGSVVIGTNAGSNAGSQSVSIGIGAGSNLGFNSVAIGANAGGTASGSICLNATGLGLNPTTSGLYIEPLRDLIPAGSAYNVFYDTGTKEVFYNTTGAGSANLTSVVVDYAETALISGAFTENNLSENLILTGGKWLIQTQYKIFSGTASAATQQLLGSIFTLEGFGGFGSSSSSQEYLLSTFTGGGYTSKLTFTHHTTAIVSNAGSFSMLAKVVIPGQSLSGGCFGAGQATAVRIGDA